MAAARAAVQTARLNLGHAQVTAPIAGRIGRALVTEVVVEPPVFEDRSGTGVAVLRVDVRREGGVLTENLDVPDNGAVGGIQAERAEGAGSFRIVRVPLRIRSVRRCGSTAPARVSGRPRFCSCHSARWGR